MTLASKIGTDRATVYSQDISQKSTNLLRMNLILNGLSHSIHNIVQGNTILHNKHTEKMDYIASNPPFKLDFSEWRDEVETLPDYTTRFFAGVPKTPKKAKDKMAIYELFIQHIIYSLKDNGKAAIVVPTIFLTAQSGIDKKIRKFLVDNNWIEGTLSMPSNIFATTGTSVSVIFINKSRDREDNIVLMDASDLGSKVKEGKNQKTVLSQTEESKIINTFINIKEIKNLSVVISTKDIQEKNYSLSAGQYFPIEIEYKDIDENEFKKDIEKFKQVLLKLNHQSQENDNSIEEKLSVLKFNKVEEDKK